MSQPGLFEEERPAGAATPTTTAPEDERGIPPEAERVPAKPARRASGSAKLPKKVVLVDGHALAFRSYFAIQSLTTTRGEPVHAVYGFLRTLLKLIRDGGSRRKASGQDHAVIVVFDAPAKTFRHENFVDYKAGRAPTPTDLPAQIRRIKHLVDLIGLSRFEQAGYEADDIIGTLARRAEGAGIDVRILTSDRDAYQLLSDRVKVLTTDYQELGPEDVKAKYGVSVSQWVDYRALTGDSSDNIPGAKGIGPKTAQKLLEDYGSLDYILAHLDEVKPDKVAEKVRESYENVIFSRELSRIVTSVEVEIDFAAAQVREPNVPELSAALRELEFSSFMRELGLENRSEVKMRDWTPPTEGVVFGYVLSEDSPVAADLTGIAYADSQGDEGAVCDATTPGPEALGAVRTLHAADAKALAVYGCTRGLQVKPGDDPLLMAYVIDSNLNEPQKVAQRFLEEDWPRDAAGRASAAARLLQVLPGQMPSELRALYEDMERPVSEVLALMEARGVRLDAKYLAGLSLAMGARMRDLEAQVWELAGEQFNLNSRDKLETILYDKLQLASGRKTKLTGKRSTAVSALEPLRYENPIVDKLLEYREMAKLKGTYLDPLPALVSERTGRLHTTFSQTVAATGRLSSLNPNLQNIPVRTEVGREIRKAFIADDGFKFMSADYSQIELRILAHMVGETDLIEGFKRGEDIHTRTAATIFGVPLEQVTADQRRGAKTINYGVLYGMSAHRLARDVGMEYAAAAAFIERYFGAYPGIGHYVEETKAFCRANGYVQDLFKRRRFIPEITAGAFPVREAAERAAVNMPIQGTSAGIIKLAMISLEPRLTDLGARLLLQVHDKLVMEVPEDRVAECEAVVRDTMENAFEMAVPLGVGVGCGDNWYDAK